MEKPNEVANRFRKSPNRYRLKQAHEQARKRAGDGWNLLAEDLQQALVAYYALGMIATNHREDSPEVAFAGEIMASLCPESE